MNESNPNEPDYGGFVPDGAGPEAEEGFYNLNELSAAYYAQPAPGAPAAAVRPRLGKKQIILIAVGAAVLVLALALFLIFHKTEFERVADGALDICGRRGGRPEEGYFTLDTNPFEKDTEDMELYELMLIEDITDSTLDAIQYANEGLGFTGAVYNRMMNTNALMGSQTASNDKYTVSWTYHPTYGLEVTYEVN